MQVRAEDSCDEYPAWKYATSLFSRSWNRRLFSVAERVGELENPRFAPPTLSLTRFSPLALALKLLWITSLLLLLSLQCFTIVKCYDTSRPRSSVFTVQLWLWQVDFHRFPFVLLFTDFTDSITVTAADIRYSANREMTSYEKRHEI